MEESTFWTWGTIGGMTMLGASAGVTVLLAGAVTPAELGALFFVSTFVTCGLSMQLYRRGLGHSTFVGAASGALAVLAFFVPPTLEALGHGHSIDRQAALMLLLVAPLTAGALSGAGTLLLANGVKRYRAQNGMTHAPRIVGRP
ncbi:MAG: hypothetical protein WDA16_08395 [Candidatus Thermoplasmatota archaeon]